LWHGFGSRGTYKKPYRKPYNLRIGPSCAAQVCHRAA
jgi:hypothetical protein